jgi:cation diffusion facilitator CzcD-associated flavoprotein CzcO
MEDRFAGWIRNLLPTKVAHRLIRWKNILLSMYLYQLCRRAPERAKAFFHRGLVKELPPDVDVDVHFKPQYQPWDQRVCFVPDADLFRAMRAGRASVVTDQIARFTAHGVLLKSGRELPADIIVTATGLKLLACGGIRFRIDGTIIEPRQCLTYKGLLLSNVPNCAFCVGYTNASWTLRAELSSMYVCRLLNHMDRHGYTQCVPRCNTSTIQTQPLLSLTSGYIQRGSSLFPKQGVQAPWVLHQNYLRDLLSLYFGRVDDGTMVFSKSPRHTDANDPDTDHRVVPVTLEGEQVFG